ncbi:hypothetical protein J5N97_013341 [Dioscorea zingiberensis]|uniref:Uncharacterized protein n=1 Tax=Dioscorea zingiberensis TaxID=325984 RepID=A0A9D5HIY7_9LILI|nr:hypothetical protein J5N97_013341 [Dioscorea zingiberensis]
MMLDDQKHPNTIHRTSGRSPDLQKDSHSSSLPMVHPFSDILGNDVPSIQVGGLPKLDAAGVPHNSSKTQRTASSSSMGSSDGNLASLIDFNVDSEPSASVPTQETVPQQPVTPPVVSTQPNVPQQTNPANESVLDQLSAPRSAPAGNVQTSTIPGHDNFSKINNPSRLPEMIQNPEAVLSDVGNSSINPASSESAPNNLSRGPSVSTNMQGGVTAPAGHPSLAITGVLSRIPAETKPIGRMELPEDFFTSIYPSAPTSFPGWQRAPHASMGYGMQFHVGDTMQAIPRSAKSSNPFDLADEPSIPHAPSFPCMASLQGAMPNMTDDPPLPHSASLGTLSPQCPCMLQQGLADMPHQVPSNSFPTINQGAAFGTSGMNQNPGARN